MHVLILGGNRFVGLLLGWRLLAAGHRVTLLNRGNLPDPFSDRVERLRGDRTTPDLERLLAGRRFDAAVDLCAFTGEDGRRIAAALGGRVAQYLLVSTGQVYLVRSGCPRPAREEDYRGPLLARPPEGPDRAEWDYGMGKRACEEALAEAHAASGFPVTVVRIPMVNGERDYHRRLERYLWRLRDGGPLLLPDGGREPVRHVAGGEVARFLAGLLGRSGLDGRAFNLAQEETPTLREILERARELVGSASPLIDAPRAAIEEAGLDPVLLSPFSGRWMSFLDPALVRAELGFRHEPLAATLGKAAACFLAHPPPTPPPGLERRGQERALAARLA